ncbi:phage virion morphogenesis protein [Rhodoferax sp.]|uniref:phage virion morphogenesis protein n=1 Tax=Rhodoferax sp. TaxID=50421 RepID=UPI002ACD45E6|nr:phage virion morphogenesis protein [Rhodoferax sp.]MDZ7920755.1 phage virion morphogenesis protein [Rhodoferax sp.]
MSAGIAIDANIEGLAGVGDAFSRMVRLGYRPRPIWDAIGQYGESSTRLRFKNQRDPEGKRWVPSMRAQQFGPGRTLIRSARLLRNISYNADDRGTSWGSNVIYARIHNDGGEIKAKGGGALRFRLPSGAFVTVKKVTIPQRTFIGVNAEDAREMQQLAVEVLYNAARNPSAGYSVGKDGA